MCAFTIRLLAVAVRVAFVDFAVSRRRTFVRSLVRNSAPKFLTRTDHAPPFYLAAERKKKEEEKKISRSAERHDDVHLRNHDFLQVRATCS